MSSIASIQMIRAIHVEPSWLCEHPACYGICAIPQRSRMTQCHIVGMARTLRSRLYEYQMKLAYLSHEIQTGM